MYFSKRTGVDQNNQLSKHKPLMWTVHVIWYTLHVALSNYKNNLIRLLDNLD